MANDMNIAPIPYKTPLIDSTGLLTVPWISWLRQLFLRVGGNNANLLNNPMTTAGDLIYGGDSSGTPSRLPADISNSRRFLRSQSLAGIATPPVWDLLQAGDIPALSYVTSVAMTTPGILSVSGSPVTSSGTLALSLATQIANAVFAGPTSGGASTPTFRALTTADIPALNYVTSVAMSVPSFLSISGTPITSSGTLALALATQNSNTVFAGPTSGAAATPSFRSLVASDIPALSYVTSVGMTVPSFLSVSGSPITSSGTLALTLSGTALPASAIPAFTGDITTSSGSTATTAAATQANITTLSSSSGVAVHGTNTNNNASSGYVGEYIQSVTTPTVAFGNSVWGDATSISLTAGDWDVTAFADFTIGTAVSWTQIGMGISTTTGNSTTGLTYGSNRILISPPPSSTDAFGAIPNYRLSLSVTTTVYLKTMCAYASGTPGSNGCRLSARRIR